MTFIGKALGAGAILMLAGCGSLFGGALDGEPELNTNTLALRTPPAGTPAADSPPAECVAALAGLAADQSAINDCIYTELTLIDLAYDKYKKSLFLFVNHANAGTDIFTLGLGTAIPLIPGSTPKSILGAISAGTIGAKGKIDADVLYNNSVSLVITQMDADRSKQKALIIGRINSSVAAPQKTPYPLRAAADDVLEYYNAGTFTNAMLSLASSVGSQAKSCQDKVAAAKGATAAATDTAGNC